MMAQSDPFRDLDGFLGRFVSRTASPNLGAMDVYRRGTDVWLHVDLPGIAADSIDVTIERGVLTISGERSWVRQEGDQLYLSERQPGQVRRQLHLGDGFDPDGIEADYHDGVLTLRVPVAQQAQPRKIAVTTRPAVLEASAS